MSWGNSSARRISSKCRRLKRIAKESCSLAGFGMPSSSAGSQAVTQRYRVLSSQTKSTLRRKLPIVNKRPRLSSRGYARGTTRYGTTEVCGSSKRSRTKVIESCRETNLSLTELERRGEIFFRALYGETADGVQALLDKIYPDMGTYTMPLEYADLERRRRVVQQHDCLRINIRPPRNLEST